jgi:hypothetical protein
LKNDEGEMGTPFKGGKKILPNKIPPSYSSGMCARLRVSYVGSIHSLFENEDTTYKMEYEAGSAPDWSYGDKKNVL